MESYRHMALTLCETQNMFTIKFQAKFQVIESLDFKT